MSFKSFLSNIKKIVFSKEIDFDKESKQEKISNYIDSTFNRKINEESISQDISFLTELKDVVKQNPADILTVLKRYKKGEETNLGFGYKQIKKTTTWGYGGVLSELIFKNDELIAYKIYPIFPNSKDLTNRYIKLFSGTFKIENGRVYNRYYELEKVENPIKEFRKSK